MATILTFSETEIQRLFGDEAADSEDLERLREYYFKNEVYEQFTSDLPLRILVGHKGIGKSALIRVAMAEDEEAGKLSVQIKPDDIVDIGVADGDFLKMIRNWKDGIIDIVTSKILRSLGQSQPDGTSNLKRYGGHLIEFLKNTFKSTYPTINLDPSKRVIIEQFLKSGVITVFIDDLDRGWEGKRPDIQRISALLNAVRDLSADNKGLRFRISLRSDVYYLVRTADESTDKIEGSVLWQTWDNHEIFVLLVKRIETFFGREINERELLGRKQPELATFLNPVIEPYFRGQGKWENAPTYRILMSLIRKRPRDLVKLLTLAAKDARSSRLNRIMTENLRDIFSAYSQGRVQDTVNEFRSELPDIERLLLNMKPSKRERNTQQGYMYDTAQLLKKIENICQGGEFRFANAKVATHKQLHAFMYKINFLTARKRLGDEEIGRKYFEENRYLSSEIADFGFDWEIHPAYRWALQPDDPREIFNTLALSD